MSLLDRCAPERRAELEALIAAFPGSPASSLEARAVARGILPARGTEIGRALERAERWSRDAPHNFLENVPAGWWRRELSIDDVLSFWRARAPVPAQLYLHVPFCRTRCAFCQCDSVVAKDTDETEVYLRTIEEEAQRFRDGLGRVGVRAATIGGGTPSHLGAGELARVLAAVDRVIAIERDGYSSVELNPDSTSEEKLAVLHAHAIARVSLGVQSFHSPTLQAVARGYQTTEHVERAVALARRFAFQLALDLIAPLPLETEASFAEGCARAFALEPEELVLYRYQPVRRGDRLVVSGELSWEHAAATFAEIASASGYALAPVSGGSVVARSSRARDWAFRYTQHAPEPRSTLGLGPFSESHVFGAGCYRREPDRVAYRGAAIDLDHERASQLGRRIAYGAPLSRTEWRSTFGAEPEEHRPAVWAYLEERGAVRILEDRIELSSADAWLFADATRLRMLRAQTDADDAWEAGRARAGVVSERAAALAGGEGAVVWEDVSWSYRAFGDGTIALAVEGPIDVIDPLADRSRALGAELDAIAASVGARWSDADREELLELGRLHPMRATWAGPNWEISCGEARWTLASGEVERATVRGAPAQARDLAAMLARRVPRAMVQPLSTARRIETARASDMSVELSGFEGTSVDRMAASLPGWARATAQIREPVELVRAVVHIAGGAPDWGRSWLGLARPAQRERRVLPLALGRQA